MQESKFLALFFVVSKIICIFAGRVRRTHSAEGALCTNLANGNVGNFHSNVQEGTTVPRYMRGAVDPISH